MSDIHGHKDEFDEMLKKISFSNDDVLYVIGDIIDRGSQSGEMLLYAVEKAPSNIVFMMGNHEDMMGEVVIGCGSWPRRASMDLPWTWNGGYDTLCDLEDKIDDNWLPDVLVPWLISLPMFVKLEVNGKRFVLVHAGFDPDNYEKRDVSLNHPKWFGDQNMGEHTRQKFEDVGWGFGRQYDQDMLWERGKWIVDPQEAPCDVVFGHTYIPSGLISECESRGIRAAGGGGAIAHILNKHGIDCGCGHAGHTETCSTDKHRLACLRLDDMSEYYVDCIEDESDDDE